MNQNRIINTFRNDYHIVTKPDHPYTYSSPDYLISRKGNLLGLFLLNTRAKFKYLLPRIKICKLAYPKNMKCVILTYDKYIREFEERNLFNNFHEVLPMKDFRYIKTILEDKTILKRIETVPASILKMTYQRYEKCLTENLLYFKENTKRHYSLTKLNRNILLNKEILKNYKIETIKKDILQINNSNFLAFLQFKNHRNFNSKAITINNYSSDIDYQIDNGVPYPTQYSRYTKILNLDYFPYTKFDSNKFIRSASFSGWITLNTNRMDEIFNRINKEI